MKKKELQLMLRQHDKQMRKTGTVRYRQFCLQVLSSKESETARKMVGMIRANQIPELLAFADSLLDQKYSSASEQFDASQYAHLVRKFPWAHPLLKPEETARIGFYEAEEVCRQTNRRFLLHQPLLESYLHDMRQVIQYVFGVSPDMDRVLAGCDFGPGSSIGITGDATSLARKLLADTWAVTPGAYYYARWAIKENPHLFELEVRKDMGFFSYDPLLFDKTFGEKAAPCRYNKIAFVLKTALTKRVIAVDPPLNTFVQKGVDTEMRLRLKRWGIDLSNQEANQYLAFLGSICWESPDPWVTVDLRRASDCMAREPIRATWPPEWYELFDALRCKYYKEGKKVEMLAEKFVSMGNGFCFPLESAMFAAACHAVGCGKPGKDFLVYGDDIIVRRSKVHELLWLLGELGFEPNVRKTCIEGPFRESCGADYFNGENVRPIVCDDPLDSISKVITLHNQILLNPRWKAWMGSSVLRWLREQVPYAIRPVAPYESCGNEAFLVEMDEFLGSPLARYNASTWTYSWHSWRVSPKPDNFWRGHVKGDLVHLIGGLRGSDSRKPFTYRRETVTTVVLTHHGAASSNWLPA